MPVVTTRQLLEAGVHFGHQTRRWNPKMKRFIFTERNGIYILDLKQTVSGIERAYGFTRDLVAGGGTILFVATKKQLQDAVKDQAERSGMPYVNFRWLGGMLTNFRTMHDRIKRMRELEEMIETGSIESFSKKEQLKLTRQYAKLERNLGGLKNLSKAPDAVFILDTKKEEIAVREAKKLGVPVVAVLDTNSDPDDADFGIPGNDDAIRSGMLLTRIIADAVIEGMSMRPSTGTEEKPEAPAAKPAEVLPGAAAEPKAEWELQLEAEEAAEQAKKAPEPSQSETPGVVEGPDAKGDEPGDLSHPTPKPDDTSTASQADGAEDTKLTTKEASESTAS
ncbi:MAG: 30S ribosomal protein S2 [Actinomycetota bacterium]